MKPLLQKPVRIIICTNDVQNIMGCSQATARRRLRKIRYELNKTPYSFITLREFCRCTGIEEDFVREFLS